MACFTLVYLGAIARYHLRSEHITDAAHEVYLAQMSCVGVLLALMLLVCGVCLWKRLPAVVGATTIELCAVVLMCVAMVATVLSEPPKAAKLFFGPSLHQVYGRDTYASDSSCLMIIDGVVTAVHLGLPMRWHMMLPLEATAVALYAGLVFIRGSDEPTRMKLFNLIFLTSMVVATGVGKRILEASERTAFAKVIQERLLRCEAEFKLNQVEVQREGGPRVPSEAASEARPRSQPDSLSQSNLSARIFDALRLDGADLKAQLAVIAEMGRMEHWCIGEGEVKTRPEDVLGMGSFGVVIAGDFCGMRVAVKRPREELSEGSIKHLVDLANELRVLRRLRHPNIVHTLGAVISPDEPGIALVLEKVDGVTIDEYLTVHAENVSASARFQIIYGVCLALFYMHTRTPPVVHGDIKTTNIMVEASGEKATPKLLDFGLARVVTRSTRALGGTLAWMAPEVLFNRGPTRCSADVYSFGCLIAYVATSTPPPMAGWSRDKIKRAWLDGSAPLPSWPRGCAFEPSCRDLVDSCLESGEQFRPSMAELQGDLCRVAGELALEGPLVGALSEGQASAQPPPPPPPQRRRAPTQLPREGMDWGAELPSPRRPALPEAHQLSPRGAEPPSPRAPARVDDDHAAMAAAILDLTVRREFQVQSGSCCTFHARAHQVMAVMEAMLGMPCFADWSKEAECPRCRMMGLNHSQECMLCGVLKSRARSEAGPVSGTRMQL